MVLDSGAGVVSIRLAAQDSRGGPEDPCELPAVCDAGFPDGAPATYTGNAYGLPALFRAFGSGRTGVCLDRRYPLKPPRSANERFRSPPTSETSTKTRPLDRLQLRSPD